LVAKENLEFSSNYFVFSITPTPNMYADEKYHEQIRIEEGSSGHSYEAIFGRFLDASVTEVHVEDSYIRSTHQACIIFVTMSFTNSLCQAGPCYCMP